MCRLALFANMCRGLLLLWMGLVFRCVLSFFFANVELVVAEVLLCCVALCSTVCNSGLFLCFHVCVVLLLVLTSSWMADGRGWAKWVRRP